MRARMAFKLPDADAWWRAVFPDESLEVTNTDNGGESDVIEGSLRKCSTVAKFDAGICEIEEELLA